MILEAIKIGIIYDIDIKNIIREIEKYKSYDKRLNEIVLDNYTIVDDSYNASYESMRCGLNSISKINSKKIIILGDMLELGKYSKYYHKKITKILNKIDNKIILTVGKYTKYIKGVHFDSNKDLISYLNSIDINNTIIYVKGSNSMKLYEIVDYLKKE